jgi:hypothetical protein
VQLTRCGSCDIQFVHLMSHCTFCSMDKLQSTLFNLLQPKSSFLLRSAS